MIHCPDEIDAATYAACLRDRGCETRDEWLEMLADENCVPVSQVRAMADLLGPNEDFDGLVTSCEDAGGNW